MSKENTTVKVTPPVFAVPVGKDVYEVKPTANGVNVRVNSTSKTLFFPTLFVASILGAIANAASLIPSLFGTEAETVTTQKETAPRPQANAKALGGVSGKIRRNQEEKRLGLAAGSLRGPNADQLRKEAEARLAASATTEATTPAAE